MQRVTRHLGRCHAPPYNSLGDIWLPADSYDLVHLCERPLALSAMVTHICFVCDPKGVVQVLGIIKIPEENS